MTQPNWRSFCNQLGIPFIVDYYEQFDMDSTDKNTALKAGVIDGYIECDPYASIAEMEGFGKIVGTEWGAANVSEDRTEGWGVHCGYFLNTDTPRWLSVWFWPTAWRSNTCTCTPTMPA